MNTTAERWLTEHRGDKCSNCNATYAACTKRIFDKGLKACCPKCEQTDTHNHREKGSATVLRTASLDEKTVQKIAKGEVQPMPRKRQKAPQKSSEVVMKKVHPAVMKEAAMLLLAVNGYTKIEVVSETTVIVR